MDLKELSNAIYLFTCVLWFISTVTLLRKMYRTTKTLFYIQGVLTAVIYVLFIITVQSMIKVTENELVEFSGLVKPEKRRDIGLLALFEANKLPPATDIGEAGEVAVTVVQATLPFPWIELRKKVYILYGSSKNPVHIQLPYGSEFMLVVTSGDGLLYNVNSEGRPDFVWHTSTWRINANKDNFEIHTGADGFVAFLAEIGTPIGKVITEKEISPEDMNGYLF